MGSSRGETNLAPQVLYHALWKLHLLGTIGYILLGQILIYHELYQFSHNLGGRYGLGNLTQYNVDLGVPFFYLGKLLRQPKIIGF